MIRTTFPLFILFVMAAPSMAAFVPPADLSPGDEYRIIFVTAGQTPGSLPNIAEYDDFVQSEADAGVASGLPDVTGWKAVGSTSSVNAIDRISDSTTPVYNTFGTRVRDSYDLMWGGALSAPVGYTQHGTPVGFGNAVWTGTYSNGTSTHFEALGGSLVWIGDSTQSGSSWIQFLQFNTPGDTCPVYGISPILTIQGLTTVPEPTTAVMWTLLSAGLMGIGWRRPRKR